MLKDNNFEILDVKKRVEKDLGYRSDTENFIHLTEVWKSLNKDGATATARALVDICCHPTVGGVRDQIEDLLLSPSSSHNGKEVSSSGGSRKHSGSSTVPELDNVIDAVIKIAPDQWFSFGLQLGYKTGQLDEYTKDLANGAEKLQKVILLYAGANGKVRAAQQVLRICQILPKPVDGAVLDLLGLRKDKEEECKGHGSDSLPEVCPGYA
jgi:hypothetical protein